MTNWLLSMNRGEERNGLAPSPNGCQFAATALGNIAVQARALGHFANLEEARRAIAEAFPPEVYTPSDA